MVILGESILVDAHQRRFSDRTLMVSLEESTRADAHPRQVLADPSLITHIPT